MNSGFVEVESGLWLPREVELQTIVPAEHQDYREQDRGMPILSTRIKVTKQINLTKRKINQERPDQTST